MDEPADRLKKARIAAGYATATEAAHAMGMKPPTYLGHENGTTGLRRTAAIRYAKFFGLSLDWLLTGTGDSRGKGGLVPVVGYVGPGGHVYFYDSSSKGRNPEHVSPPPDDINAHALRISGDSMQPLREGWLLFYGEETDGVPRDCVGQICIVQVQHGPVLVRTVSRGSPKNHWRLSAWNASTSEDVKVEWASKIVDIRPQFTVSRTK